MSERQDDQMDEPDSGDGKTSWTRPQVDRLLAGGAEGSADISVDGVDFPS